MCVLDMDQRITHHVLQFHCKMLQEVENNPWRSVLDLGFLAAKKFSLLITLGTWLIHLCIHITRGPSM